MRLSTTQIRTIRFTVPAAIGAVLLLSSSAFGDIAYSVILNTSALASSTDVFALDFQLIQGGGGTANQVGATQFNFGLGSADASSANLTGGASIVSSPLAVGLDDTNNFFNEVVLPFVPGNSLSFLVSTTTQLSVFPD